MIQAIDEELLGLQSSARHYARQPSLTAHQIGNNTPSRLKGWEVKKTKNFWLTM